jgi:hypothetical protein
VLVITFAGAGAWLIAQTRVDTRVGPVSPSTPVNRNLYNPGTVSSSSVRYAGASQTSRPMNSELRYQYRQSGALPSDIRMAYAGLGPLHPSGPQAYIPPRTNYANRPSAPGPPPAPRPSPVSSSSPQSVRYASRSSAAPGQGSPSVSRPAPSAQVSGALVSRPVSNAAPSGTVRYSR